MNEGVYFKSITIENLKCFKKRISVDFSYGFRFAPWTIIIGENGTGKTTLIQSLALIAPKHLTQINQEAVPFKHSSEIPYPLNTNEKSESNLKLALVKGLKSIAFETVSVVLKSDKALYKGISSSFQMTKVFAYGATRRLDSRTSLKLSKDERIDNIDHLFNSEIPLINAEEWLLEAESLSIKAKNKIAKSYHERRYHTITKVLIELLPDVSDIRIKEVTIEDRKVSIELKTPYGWVEMNELSHGYKSLIGWTVDYAHKLFEAYPESKNPLKEPAICIIDEIDLHLHPKWQRTVMQDLSQHFPKTQFIATAHSPLIVQSNPEAHIVLLKREGDHVVAIDDISQVKSWRIDQILTSDLFDLDSAWGKEISELKVEKNVLLEKAELKSADEKRIQEINEILEKQNNTGDEIDTAIRFLKSLKS